MQLDDFKDFVEWNKQLDMLCRAYLKWQEAKHNKNNWLWVPWNYDFFQLQSEGIKIFCNNSNGQYCFMLKQIFDAAGKEFKFPEAIHASTMLYYEHINAPFEDLIEKYEKRVETMKFSEYMWIDEGLQYLPDSQIKSGKSKFYAYKSTIPNYFYHFELDGHTYDVFGFNSHVSISVIFERDGDYNFEFAKGSKDVRKIFGGVVQCVNKEVKQSYNEGIKKITFTGKIGSKVQEFYESNIFREIIKKETGYAHDGKPYVDSGQMCYTYVK